MLVPELEGQEKGALLKATRWSPGAQISVSFLDGDPDLRERVMHYAEQWIQRSGIDLCFVWRKNTNDTRVRVSFRYTGSWSYLGRYCETVQDKNAPTINFGWLRPHSSDLAVQSVVLHEFGHVFGLIHEHQHPLSEIPWDVQAVYEDLAGPPNNWDEATIHRNLFRTFDRKEVYTTPFDPDSIMIYPIPNRWTEGDYEVRPNTDLSAGDIRLIQEVYE